MLIKKAAAISSSEITDENVYFRRREFIRMAGGAIAGVAAASALGACGRAAVDAAEASGPAAESAQTPIQNIAKKMVTTTEPLNTFEEITSYNNFYEFGTGKGDPQALRRPAEDQPVDGQDRRPVQQARATTTSRISIKTAELEERVYRLRCVEAWSMVIPWVGIPARARSSSAPSRPPRRPSSSSRRVLRPAEMPGLPYGGLNWPVHRGAAAWTKRCTR